MKAKTLILLFVALGCGMIAAVAVSKAVMNQGSAQPQEAMVEIFVAVKDLDHQAKISAENVKLEKWPKARLPEGAVFDLEKIEQKFARQTIFAGEPILERKIADSRDGFATTLPSGHRIFDISDKSSYIKAGDHVDIVGTFRPNGRTGAPETRTVMRNVKVHGINGNTSREVEEGDGAKGGLTKATVFQLLVKESQLEALTLANSLGTLKLHLRPFNEGQAEEDTGQEFLEWINAEAVKEDEDEDKGPTMFTEFSAPEFQAPPVEEKKQSMVIVTPNGVKKFEWSGDKDIPQEVNQAAESTSDLQANNRGYPTANVYSGYGGYPPTYPISTGAQPVPQQSMPASPPRTEQPELTEDAPAAAPPE